jgi:hypothetical protein
MKNSIARSTLIALAAVLVAAGCTDESKTVAQVDGGSDGDTDGDADGDSDTGVDDDPFEDCTSVTEGASNTYSPPISCSPSTTRRAWRTRSRRFAPT